MKPRRQATFKARGQAAVTNQPCPQPVNNEARIGDQVGKVTMAATFEEFTQEFSTIVEEDVKELTRERELLSIPLWDSLAIVTVMALASDKFDQIVEPDRISAAVTVGELFALLAPEGTTT
jgi:acyl carrier protein